MSWQQIGDVTSFVTPVPETEGDNFGRARHDDRYPPGVPADVAELFEQFALDAAAAGRKKYSSRGICHRIRWHAHVESKGSFKVNNLWSRPLAEWFMARHPELPDFFETRERNSEDEVA